METHKQHCTGARTRAGRHADGGVVSCSSDGLQLGTPPSACLPVRMAVGLAEPLGHAHMAGPGTRSRTCACVPPGGICMLVGFVDSLVQLVRRGSLALEGTAMAWGQAWVGGQREAVRRPATRATNSRGS